MYYYAYAKLLEFLYTDVGFLFTVHNCNNVIGLVFLIELLMSSPVSFIHEDTIQQKAVIIVRSTLVLWISFPFKSHSVEAQLSNFCSLVDKKMWRDGTEIAIF